ncbi:hypothetical protein GCM10027614_31200 [Micromonospora vulcania]
MDADTVVGTELRWLRRRRPEVAGTVLAGTDGLLISSDLPSTDATHLAALAAASFGLGNRVADTVRRGEFRESVVRTTAGCVVTYPAGRTALLTLVTVAMPEELESLHEEAGRWPAGPARCWTSAAAGSAPPPYRTRTRRWPCVPRWPLCRRNCTARPDPPGVARRSEPSPTAGPAGPAVGVRSAAVRPAGLHHRAPGLQTGHRHPER